MKIFRLVSGAAAVSPWSPAWRPPSRPPPATAFLRAPPLLSVRWEVSPWAAPSVRPSLQPVMPPVVYRAPPPPPPVYVEEEPVVLRAPRPPGLCGALLHRALPRMGSRTGAGNIASRRVCR